MTGGRNITLGLGFKVNKSGLNELTSILQQIEQQALKIAKQEGMDKELKETIATAKELQKILNSSWNSNLNQLDLNRLNSSITKSYGSLGNLKTQLDKVGAGKAFDSLAKNILNTNVQLKQSNTLLDQMATTMANTVKWGIASSIFNNITGSIQEAWNYTKALDSSLNDIRIVTNKSADEMANFAVQANKVAKSLGAATKDYTNASLIYYQQGLSEEDVQARAQTTLKAANVTGQTGEEVSQQLTAVWNGYKVSAQEAELYVDKLAAVAAETAADLEELSTGMSKVASAANIMGVDIDQLNAQLATIVSVTRQAPESVGTALKTIYARMGDIKAGLDGEVTLDEYTSQMAEMGVNVLDANGNLRDMGAVIEEIGANWTSMSREQQVSLSQIMAGTRQYNNLLSLFDNWDMYTEALNTSAKAAGTLQEQEEIYLESTSAHLQKLATEAERTYDILFDQELINGFTDALTGALTVFNNFLNSFGGGFGTVVGLGSIATGMFSKQIAGGIAGQMAEQQKITDNKNLFTTKEEIRKFYQEQGLDYNDAGLEAALETYNKIRNVRHLMSEEEQSEYNLLQQKTTELSEQLDIYENFGKTLKGIPGLGRGSNNRKTFSTNELDEWLNTNKAKLAKITATKNNIDEALLLTEQPGRLSQNTEYLKILDKEKISEDTVSRKNKQLAVSALTRLKENTIAEEKALAEQIDKVTQARKISTQATQENINALKAQIHRIDEDTTQTKENYEAQLALQEGIQLVSSGVAAATSLWNIFSTALDENLSASEKAKIIFSSLGTTIFSTMAFMKNLVDFQNAGGFATLGPALLKFAVNLGIVDASVIGTTFSLKTLGTVLNGLWVKLWPIVLVLGALAAAYYVVNKAVTQHEKDLASATEQVEILTNRYNELTEKVNNLKSSMSEYDEAKDALKDLEKGTKEFEDALEKTNDKAKELIETYKLYDDFTTGDFGEIVINSEALEKAENEAAQQQRNVESSLYAAKIKENQSKQRYTAVELSRSMGLDWQAIVKTYLPKSLLGNMGISVTASDIANKIATGNEDFKNVTTEEIRQFANMLNTIQNEFGASALENNDRIKEILESMDGYNGALKENIDKLLESKEALIEYADSIKAMSKENEYYIKEIANNEVENKLGKRTKELVTDKEGNIDQTRYNLIASAASRYTTKGLQEDFLAAEERVKDISGSELGDYEEYEKIWSKKDLMRQYAIDVLGVDKTKLSFDDDGNLLEDGTKLNLDDLSKTEMREALAYEAEKKKILSDIDTNKAGYVQEIMGSISEELSKSEGTLGNISNVVLSAIANGTKEFDFSSVFKDLSPDEISQLSSMTEEEIINFLGILPEDIQALGIWIGGELGKFWQLGFEPYDIAKYIEKTREKIATLSDSIASMYKGDELSDEQLESLQALEQEYEILGTIQDKNSRMYLEALIAIQQQEEENARIAADFAEDKLIKEFDEKDYEVGVEIPEGDIDTIREQLKEIAEADYEVLVSIKTDAQSDFDNIINTMDNLKDAAESIGDNYIVAAEDLEELGNAYPGILENAQLLTDGTMKLNQESVKSSMAAAQKEVELSKQEVVEKLRNQQAELEGKQAAAQKIADIATNLANNEVELDKVKGDIDKELNNLKSDNAKESSDYEQETQVDVVTASQSNSEAMATNFSGAYKKMAEDSAKWAEASRKNMLYATGQGNELDTGMGINTKYTATGAGKTVSTAALGELSGGQDISSSTDWNAVAEYYNNLAKGYGEAANNIQGKIAEILARNSEFNYNTGNIAKGLGSDGKSDGKNADIKETIEDEKDIYHDINIILKQISTELDRLEKQEKKLIGQDLIDNLNEQWGRLQDTIDATNEKIKIARGEMSRLQGELGAKGVTFNPDGTIANYAAAYDQQLATVNAVIAHYNSLSAEAQEGYKDTVEQAEKNWEEFLDNISKYDELVSEMIPELEDEIQAAIDEQIEIQIEKFNMEIELRLDMAEAEREWNEFKKKIIDDIEDDDILGNASAKLLDYSSYYKEDGTGVIQKNTQHVNEIIEQLKSIEATGTSSIYGDNEAQALEDLKTYYEQLMSDLTDVHDLIDEIRESYLDMMDEAQEKFDEQVETYEYIRDLLTHDMDLITMVYGDESYDKLVDFYQKQEENYNKQIDFQKQQKEFWKAQMDSLEEGSDEWQQAKENWMSAVEEWNSLVEEAIENLQDKYLNAINNIFANLNDKVTDGLGLDYVEQEWDLINKNADQYLDTINAVFETQQLESKYLDAIDNTDNISAQQKLNDLMKEEIAALEQKDKLTQYDIDRANLKYEIALKQIALEEAQQTKSSMRLRRDSQGNYRYEFVADNDAIREAEDELSVLQNQLYNMDVEQYRSNLDQLYEIYVEWQEALAEAAQINDPEARAERELMINEQYGELINGIVEENEVIRTNLRESAFDELVNLHQMELEEVEALSQAEKDIMLEDMIPQWTSGVQTMADAFAGEGGFIPTCKDALNELNEATKEYEDDLVELQYQGGFTFDDIVAGETEAIYTAQGLLQVNSALIGSYQAEFDAIKNVLSQLNGLINQYGSAQNAANNAAEAAYKYADALLAIAAAANGQYSGRGGYYNYGGGSAGTSGSYSTTGGYAGSGTSSNNTTPTSGGTNKSNQYELTYILSNGKEQATVTFTASSAAEVRQKIASYGGINGFAIKNKTKGTATMGSYQTLGNFTFFKTGGYTGEWNSSEGRIGVLHEKELVLNKQDTANILNAVELIREINGSVLSRMMGATSGLGIAAPELTNGILEQNVHIEANFPNVQSSREIEEAIDNLSNIASQRALRNNK